MHWASSTCELPDRHQKRYNQISVFPSIAMLCSTGCLEKSDLFSRAGLYSGHISQGFILPTVKMFRNFVCLFNESWIPYKHEKSNFRELSQQIAWLVKETHELATLQFVYRGLGFCFCFFFKSRSQKNVWTKNYTILRSKLQIQLEAKLLCSHIPKSHHLWLSSLSHKKHEEFNESPGVSTGMALFDVFYDHMEKETERTVRKTGDTKLRGSVDLPVGRKALRMIWSMGWGHCDEIQQVLAPALQPQQPYAMLQAAGRGEVVSMDSPRGTRAWPIWQPSMMSSLTG